jgi:hypothetical protein
MVDPHCFLFFSSSSVLFGGHQEDVLNLVVYQIIPVHPRTMSLLRAMWADPPWCMGCGYEGATGPRPKGGAKGASILKGDRGKQRGGRRAGTWNGGPWQGRTDFFFLPDLCILFSLTSSLYLELHQSLLIIRLEDMMVRKPWYVKKPVSLRPSKRSTRPSGT